jgi:hypothetical protein
MDEKRLVLIGNHIAVKEGYVGLEGIEAVYRYIIDKYNWLPDQVRKISGDDLQILLAGYDEKATTDWN